MTQNNTTEYCIQDVNNEVQIWSSLELTQDTLNPALTNILCSICHEDFEKINWQ